MSPTPSSFRYPFEAEIAAESPGAQRAHRGAFQGILDLNMAIAALKGQVDANKAALSPATSKTATPAVNTAATIENVTQVVNSNVGAVVQVSGATYSSQQSDRGDFLVFSGSSPIAITLSTLTSGIVLPWYATVLNLGSATVTLSPASGTINGNSTFSLPGGTVTTVAFNGTDFFGTPAVIVPKNTPAVAHKWLASYDAATGTFALTQPSVSDISGLSADLALLAPLASPTFTGSVTQPAAPILTAATTATSATAGSASALPASPLGYLQMSLNGTLAKIPFHGV